MSREKGPKNTREGNEKVTALQDWKIENISEEELLKKLGRLQTALSNKMESDSPGDPTRYVKRKANAVRKLSDKSLKRDFHMITEDEINNDPVRCALLVVEGVNRGILSGSNLYEAYASSYTIMLPGIDIVIRKKEGVENVEPLSNEKTVDLKNYFYGLGEELEGFDERDWDNLQRVINSNIGDSWMVSILSDVNNASNSEDFITILGYTYKCVRKGLIEDDDWSDFFHNLVNIVNEGLSGTTGGGKAEGGDNLLQFKRGDEEE